MRDSFIMYRSFYEAISDLPKEDKADILDAIFEYSLNSKELELKGINKTIFKLIKPQLEANNKRFENGKTPKKPKVVNEKDSKDEAKDKQNVSKTEAEISKDEANKNVNVNPNENKNNNFSENEEILKPEKNEGFDLAGKERAEKSLTAHELTSLTIEQTKERFLLDNGLFELFVRATKLERKNFDKAIEIFIKHTIDKIEYPRSYEKGDDNSKKHFKFWFVKLNYKEFEISEPKPEKKSVAKMTPEEFKVYSDKQNLEQERDFAQNARDREESAKQAELKRQREANHLLNKKPMTFPWLQTS